MKKSENKNLRIKISENRRSETNYNLVICFGKSHATSTSSQFPCQRSLKMADKTTTKNNNMHKNHGIARLDSFIMYVKKDVLQLLTDC